MPVYASASLDLNLRPLPTTPHHHARALLGASHFDEAEDGAPQFASCRQMFARVMLHTLWRLAHTHTHSYLFKHTHTHTGIISKRTTHPHPMEEKTASDMRKKFNFHM